MDDLASFDMTDWARPAGSVVEDYEILEALGAGGFGITYRAHDHRLGGEVALKEYLPAGFATRRGDGRVAARSKSDAGIFKWGLEQVLEEARNLNRVSHPNVVRVLRHFECSGTAFIAMEYIPGPTLAQSVTDKGPWTEARYRPVFDALLSACRTVHAAGLLHRDIKPDNIILRPDGAPLLIDFGAARRAIWGRTNSMTALITPGYGPIEQYAKVGKVGPFSDIYGLASTSYFVLTGQEPVEAVDRIDKDGLSPLTIAAKGRGSQKFLAALDRGLKVKPADRPQTVDEWAKDIPVAPVQNQEPPEVIPSPKTKTGGWIAAGVAIAAIAGLAVMTHPDPNAKAKAALAQISSVDWSVKSGTDLLHAALARASTDDYRKLAEAGDAKAETLMGLLYHVGTSDVPADQFEATSWLRKAADQKDARALYDLGDVYVMSGGSNHEREAEYLKQSANLGNARGEFLLGDAYLNSRGVPKDLNQAGHWLEQAALQGMPAAEAELGHLYYTGQGVNQNYDKAATLLQKAADDNDPTGQHDLAVAYYYGNGVLQNKFKAFSYFTKAADQGNVDAQFQSGKMYVEGDGVQIDTVKGRELINKAANANLLAAKVWLGANPVTPTFTPNSTMLNFFNSSSATTSSNNFQ